MTSRRKGWDGPLLARALLPAMVAAAVALAMPSGAQAQTPEAQKTAALAKVREGNDLSAQRQYQAALGKYQAAYQIFPSPKIFFNLGATYRDLGQHVEAVTYLARFLAEAADATPESRRDAERLLQELKPKVSFVDVQCDTPGAEISVDGRYLGATPLLRPMVLLPGSHEISIAKPGSPHVFQQRIAPQAGTSMRVDVALGQPPAIPVPAFSAGPPPAAAAPAPAVIAQTPASGPAPAERPVYQRAWFWIATGAVLAAGTTAILILGRRTEAPIPGDVDPGVVVVR